MRTLIAVGAIFLAGCAAYAQTAGTMRAEVKASSVFLLADVTDTNATKCGGMFNGVRLTDVPLQPSQPKCKIDVTTRVAAGSNTWTACNSATDPTQFTEGCVTTPLTFTYSPPAAQLQPPTNMRYQEQ
jgi:hypothetical protein